MRTYPPPVTQSGKHSDPFPKDTSKEKLSTLKGVSDPSKEEPKVLEETAEEAPLRTPKKTPSQSPAALSTTTAETPVVSSKDTSQLAAKKSSDAAPEKPLPSQAALSGSGKEQERTAEADRADQGKHHTCSRLKHFEFRG